MVLNYDTKSDVLNMEARFFADDFQKCLNTELNQRLNVIKFYDQPEIQHAMDEFLNKFLKLKLNGMELPLKLDKTQFNPDNNLITGFYQFKKPILKKGKLKNILEINNQLLLSYFPAQKNIMVIHLPNIPEQIIYFDKGYTSESIHF